MTFSFTNNGSAVLLNMISQNMEENKNALRKIIPNIRETHTRLFIDSGMEFYQPKGKFALSIPSKYINEPFTKTTMIFNGECSNHENTSHYSYKYQIHTPDTFLGECIKIKGFYVYNCFHGGKLLFTPTQFMLCKQIDKPMQNVDLKLLNSIYGCFEKHNNDLYINLEKVNLSSVLNYLYCYNAPFLSIVLNFENNPQLNNNNDNNINTNNIIIDTVCEIGFAANPDIREYMAMSGLIENILFRIGIINDFVSTPSVCFNTNDESKLELSFSNNMSVNGVFINGIDVEDIQELYVLLNEVAIIECTNAFYLKMCCTIVNDKTIYVPLSTNAMNSDINEASFAYPKLAFDIKTKSKQVYNVQFGTFINRPITYNNICGDVNMNFQKLNGETIDFTSLTMDLKLC